MSSPSATPGVIDATFLGNTMRQPGTAARVAGKLGHAAREQHVPTFAGVNLGTDQS